jgi:hypothetical protein
MSANLPAPTKYAIDASLINPRIRETKVAIANCKRDLNLMALLL